VSQRWKITPRAVTAISSDTPNASICRSPPDSRPASCRRQRVGLWPAPSADQRRFRGIIDRGLDAAGIGPDDAVATVPGGSGGSGDSAESSIGGLDAAGIGARVTHWRWATAVAAAIPRNRRSGGLDAAVIAALLGGSGGSGDSAESSIGGLGAAGSGISDDAVATVTTVTSGAAAAAVKRQFRCD